MLYVTHDLGLLSQIADRVGVMYAGQDGRDRADRRTVRRSEASLHARPDRLDPADRGSLGPAGAAAARPAAAARTADGVSVRAALRLGDGAVFRRSGRTWSRPAPAARSRAGAGPRSSVPPDARAVSQAPEVDHARQAAGDRQCQRGLRHRAQCASSRCATSASTSARARRWRWSANPAAASRRWRAPSPG